MATNQARIDFRTNIDTKNTIEQAASILGMTLSDFATSILLERSRQVIEKNEERVLSNRDRDIFLALLDAPATPNDALVRAAERFKGAVNRGDLKI